MVGKISVQEQCYVHSNKRISWGSIAVGASTLLGLSFLLSLLVIVFGLSVFQPMSDGSVGLAIGGLVGMIVGVIIITLISGYVAGYLGRLYCPEQNLGIIYGFTSWVTALILAAVILGIFSQYVATYTNAVSRTVLAIPVSQISTPAGSISSTIKDGEKAVVEINVSQTNLAVGALITFIIFFLSALFTCLGASWGIRCKRDDD